MESKPKKKRKKHAEEFKREAVRLLEGRGERTVADVAASLGVAENLLHAWKKTYGTAAEQVRRERGGETPEEELKRLRREVTQLKQERDVLKKSVAVFARDRS
jgi:transposase